MTDTPQNPGNSGKHSLGKFYQLTPELAQELRAIKNMPATAWRLWSYLATFDPFGSDYLELPELTDVLAECNLSKPSFYRAIALFHEYDLFDLQPTKMYVLNLRGQRIVSEIKQLSQKRYSESQKRENHTPETPIPSSKKCTNRIKKEYKEQTIGREIDKKEFGTTVEKLCSEVENAGAKLNKTIQETIASLINDRSAAAAAAIVENAISALKEQQRTGTVRNPGGFLLAALRRSFTANAAKVEARSNQRSHPPCLEATSYAVDMAIVNGDRSFALHKIKQIWSEGWHDQIEELLMLRKDWGFSITEVGVSDGGS